MLGSSPTSWTSTSTPTRACAAYVVGIFELLTHPGALGYAGVLVREHRRLSEARPDELRRALAPMVDLLAREVAGAVTTPDPACDAQTVFALLLEGIHEVTLGHVEPLNEATYLWRFCDNALRGPGRAPEEWR